MPANPRSLDGIKNSLACPVNLKDYKAMYELLMRDLINAGTPSHHLGYLEIIYKEANRQKGVDERVVQEI